MAFSTYRAPCNSPSKPKLDIERIAYDVFAYMLRISGLPEEKIPTSNLKANTYSDKDFIMNFGLSALPISLYMRDEWKIMFEKIFCKSGVPDILEIKTDLESYMEHSDDFAEEDTISKIQYSLALYTEYTLYLDSRGIEAFSNVLPKIWSHLCKQLLATRKISDESLEIVLTMSPDISESWISTFIKNFAIPYGSSDISELFSVHTLALYDGPPEKKPSNGVSHDVPEESEGSNQSEGTATGSPEGSNIEMSHSPPESLSPDNRKKQKTECVDKIANSGHRNGWIYVLNQCSKGRKRTRTLELGVENAFGSISLEKENISPEQHDTKRRRKEKIE